MEKEVKMAAFIARLLDNQFSLFGRRFGLNGVLGLIPGGGDLATLALSSYLLVIAWRLKMPLSKLILMLWNVLLNFLIGLIPVIGDYFDFFTKANIKNLKIIQDYLKHNPVIEGEVIAKA